MAHVADPQRSAHLHMGDDGAAVRHEAGTARIAPPALRAAAREQWRHARRNGPAADAHHARARQAQAREARRRESEAVAAERAAVAGYLARVDAWDRRDWRAGRQRDHGMAWAAVRDWDTQCDDNRRSAAESRDDAAYYDAYGEPPPLRNRGDFLDEARVNGRAGRGYVPPCASGCGGGANPAAEAPGGAPREAAAAGSRPTSPPPPNRRGAPSVRRGGPPPRAPRDVQLSELNAAQARDVEEANTVRKAKLRGCVVDMHRMPSRAQSLAGVPRTAARRGDVEEERLRLGHGYEFDLGASAGAHGLHDRRQRRARLQSADAIGRASALAHLRIAGRKRDVQAAPKVVCWA